MNDVTSTVHRQSGRRANDEPAVGIDAIGDSFDAALVTQEHANATTNGVATLGV